jgi:Protein of unknown function (DUF2917)
MSSLPVFTRIMVYPTEVFRLPEGHLLRVVSGRAWLTHAGRDIVLRPGERTALARRVDAPLVSSLDRQPLVVELMPEEPGQTPGRPARLPALVGRGA